MKLRTALPAIAFIYLLGFFGHALYLKKTVYGDGRFYYSWVRSVVIDHDINFADEYAHFGIHEPKTSTGMPANKYSVGASLFWLPAVAAAHNFLRANGWSLLYQITTGLASVLAVIAGLTILISRIRRGDFVRTITLILLAGATNLLFYGSLDVVNSHSVSFFASCILVALLLSTSPDWLAVGISLGFLAAIRLQDIVFILLVIPYWKRIRMGKLITGILIGILPQLLAWYALDGSLTNPYLSGGEGFHFQNPQVLGVLFSPNNGLFLWTPVTMIGLIGLFFNWRKYWSFIAVFFAELTIVASWSTWWQGASVSGRMFVSSLPLLAFGIAEVVQRLYKNKFNRVSLPILAVTLSGINALGIIFYLVTH